MKCSAGDVSLLKKGGENQFRLRVAKALAPCSAKAMPMVEKA